MKAVIKKTAIVIGVISIILILTNPSTRRFKEYLGNTTERGLKRERNLFLFSLYKDGSTDMEYYGCLLNFFKSSDDVQQNISVDSLVVEESADQGIYTTRRGTFTKSMLNKMGYTNDQLTSAIYRGTLKKESVPENEMENKMKLWISLTKIGRYDSSYQHFISKYASLEQIGNLYSGTKEDGLFSGSSDEFIKEYFPDVK